MSIVAVGITQRTAPLDVFERLALDEAAVDKALDALAGRDDVREVAVVATCARTEVYAVAERFHGAYGDICDLLNTLGGFADGELDPYLLVQHDDGAAQHLLEVASGLDSAVIGESEILGQVRSAADVARRRGTLGTSLDRLFAHALRAGKRVRTDTAIGRGTASISHAAVEMATDHLGSLVGRRVLVVGAGTMGTGVAMALRDSGAADISVANRTIERGAELATRVGGRTIAVTDLDDQLTRCDVVVTCASGESLLTVDQIAGAVTQRSAPLLIVDIAVPRNVDPAAASLTGVTVFDLDDLRRWTERGLAARDAERSAAAAIVASSLEQFRVDSLARQAAPLVAQLRDRAEQIRNAELTRYANKLADLEGDQRDTVEALTRSIVAKLLHSPSVRLRDAAGTARGERIAAAVGDLFDLESK